MSRCAQFSALSRHGQFAGLVVHGNWYRRAQRMEDEGRMVRAWGCPMPAAHPRVARVGAAIRADAF